LARRSLIEAIRSHPLGISPTVPSITGGTKMKTGILGGAAMAALIGATLFAPVPGRASTPSSPAERAATAELNRNIAVRNAAADDQYKSLEAQYQEQIKQNEAQQRQYQAQQQSPEASLK
jgi:hypothetical protein